MVKNLPANTGDAGDVSSIPGSGRSLEEEMATHSSILVWRNPMDRRAWQATIHVVAEMDTTEHKNTNRLTSFYTVKEQFSRSVMSL